jgi:FkbH-like protein
MFQFDWAAADLWAAESTLRGPQKSRLPREKVRQTMLLHWQEHCLECAPPLCYQTCPLFVARSDQKCARFVYGMVRNPAVGGLFDFGADLRFRRWGKIEASITGRSVSVSAHRMIESVDRMVTGIVNLISTAFDRINPKRRLNGALTLFRDKLVARLGKPRENFDAFVIECFSTETYSFRLIVEIRNPTGTPVRESVEVKRGQNFFQLPIRSDVWKTPGSLLTLYPEENREPRLIFSWLDFVVLEPDAQISAEPASVAPAQAAAQPAEKIKCVAWDLDNTLWRGTLIEDGESHLVLRPEAVDLIKQLDERGIIQTVVSKNNHDDALKVIEAHGLQDYFLHPAINWGRKSANLQAIANQLNINVDTFALIDDSAFERNEVSTVLPAVRVYKEDSLAELLTLPEFQVPITSASRLRRQSYLAEVRRTRIQESFGDDYGAFLRSCEIRLRLFVPRSEQEIVRCVELIQRSNQLNLSGKRYTVEEFRGFLASPTQLCIAMECSDKFGNYGIIGFARVDESGADPVVTDFVMSCRVAQKFVERTFYAWLGAHEKKAGRARLLARFVRTKRNQLLVEVFQQLPFQTVSELPDGSLVSMDLLTPFEPEKVMDVEAGDFA